MTHYDAIVIGTGTGGGSVIWPLHRAGMRIVCIERELVGGLCAYWGCIPSKTLLRPGTIDWEASHGVGTGHQSLDWPEIARYRDFMVRNFDDTNQVEELRNAGIDFFRGTASITGPGRVSVDDRFLETDRIIIATGSESSIPPIDGLKEAGFWTNREATALKEIPSSVVVMGGGAVGCELGQMLHSFGASVSIVEMAPQLLGQENPDAARHLEQRFRGVGISLHLGRKVTKVRRSGQTRTVTLDDGTTIDAEVVLVATGRAPRVEDLGLDRVGIEPTKKGIPVDEHCRAAEGIWAVGDVTGVAGFTHVADYQGEIAVADILGHPRRADYRAIPRIVYTDPEIGTVGIGTPKDAPEGMEIITASADLRDEARTDTYGKGYQGGLGLLANQRESVLVGAWAAGPLAGEWIQWATLAIRARVPIAVLEDTILAFPTFTRLYLTPLRELMKKL